MPKTGATRYQKFLKSEKSKTKLKGKKDLPKGTNVTKTNFKVKKIIIKEQLKKHGDNEALSNRKLNLKELLSRLNHFNTNARTDALDGLKELVTSRPEVLENNLGQLIHGISPLLLNVERLVRRETLKVLHLILSNASHERVDPFFDIMSTYLRSAMTHIDSRIQEDSLLFLDLLLACVPERTAKNFHKIIPNFLDMISKLRVDSKPGRTLTVNLDSQITSAKWRVKVLHRLKDFLRKFIDCNNLDSTIKSVEKKTHVFDKNKANSFPTFNVDTLFNPKFSSFSVKPFSENDSPIDEVDKIKAYVETLMPLLFETWLEVCSNSGKEKNIENVINEDAAALLKQTIEVITLIWTLVSYFDKNNPSSNFRSFFCSKYKQAFTSNMFQSFPYVTNIRGRPKSEEESVFEDVVTDPKLIMENLEICYLYIRFNPNLNVKLQSSEINSLLNYIEKTFNHNCHENYNNSIIKILQTIFSSEVTNWTKNLTVMDSLFRKIIWIYFNQNISTSFRYKIFALLCSISFNDKLVHFHSSEAYEKWLCNLPDILLEKTVTKQTIEIIHRFAICKNKIFNSVVKPKLISIVENLPHIKLSDATHYSDIYKLFSLLYWIKCWDNASLNKLENQLMNNEYEGDHAKYIFDTLKLRSGGIYQ